MEVGEKGELIRKQAERFKEKVPDRIQNKPLLPEYLFFYYESFMELSNDRQMGFGVGPIPSNSIFQYCKFYSVCGNEFEDFLFLIRAMDSAFLKLTLSKSKKK